MMVQVLLYIGLVPARLAENPQMEGDAAIALDNGHQMHRVLVIALRASLLRL
jgi:hypothetical protein